MPDGSVRWADLPPHPTAALFPMLSEPDLADLAQDIKANGLINPILLDAAGERVVDGRNRLAACRIAGVEPRFERLAPEADPLAVVVSLNVKRRNLTGSQIAIAAAEAWLQAETEGRILQAGQNARYVNGSPKIGNPRDYFAKLFGSNKEYVRMARELLAEDPPAAEAVREGRQELRLAHADLRSRKGRDKARDERLWQLRQARPDLADLVRTGKLTLEDALQTAEQEAEALKKRRFNSTVQLIDTVASADNDPAAADEVCALFDRAVETLRGSPKITRARLERCGEFFFALARVWEDQE